MTNPTITALTEIAGMKYKRLPLAGEKLDIEASRDDAGFVICSVSTRGPSRSREILAWDQIEIPARAEWHNNAYRKRAGLAAAAAAYWRGAGFDVETYFTG